MKSWYRIRAQNDEAEIFIFDEIGFFGITAKDFIDELKALGDVERIVVRINSPGGDVFDAIAIHNALKRHKAQIEVTIEGLAASAASIIAVAGDAVLMPDNTMMMIHDPIGVVVGGADDMRRLAEALDRIKTSMVAAYRAKTGLDDDDLGELMAAETWMTAQEAVEKGFADEVLEPVKMAAKFDLSRYGNAPEDMGLAPTTEAKKSGAQEGVDDEIEAKETVMTKDTKSPDTPAITAEVVARDHPDVAAALRNEGSADAVAAERERLGKINALAKQMPGHDELVARCIDEGKGSGETAELLIAAEAEKPARALSQMRAEIPGAANPDPAPPAPAASTGAEATAVTESGPPTEERLKAQWDGNASLRAEYGDVFERFAAFEKAKASGRVRLLTKVPDPASTAA